MKPVPRECLGQEVGKHIISCRKIARNCAMLYCIMLVPRIELGTLGIRAANSAVLSWLGTVVSNLRAVACHCICLSDLTMYVQK